MTSPGSVPAGTRLGRYEIVSLLGRGGMGEVYTANDENLGRRVALKILPSHRTSDPERVARFVREAKASSALNHPAIVSIHDAGSEGNVHFLAMELIDGEPLSEWMDRGRRNLPRAVEIMAQVAEGLDRAHINGIVHRDLKPDNIMVTRDGHAKIVDFGVAKLTERTNGRRGHTGVTTPTSRIGTTAYMSPEQVEGRTVDHRADAFSFGVVLYELITGVNPFASDQYADTLHNIVHLDPPLDSVPPPLRRIVRRCLRKDPEQRYQSLKDAALDLREAAGEQQESQPRRPRRGAAVAGAAFLALIAAAAMWQIRQTENGPPAQAGRSMVMTRLTNSGKVQSATISPDGRYLVYAESVGDQEALYVKQVATGTTTAILDPEPMQYHAVRISGDGNYVYYISTLRREPNISHLFQVPLLGGTPRRIASDTEFWYSLSPDGSRVVFTRFNALDREYRMTIASTEGGDERVVLTRRPPQFIAAPVWTPDGRGITFFGGNADRNDDDRMWRFTVATGDVEPVPMPKWPGLGSYAWLPDGSGALVTAHERDQPPQIWFAPTGSTTGRKVTSEVSAYYGVTPTADSQSFVAVRDTTDSNVYTTSLEDPRAPLSPVTTGLGNFWGTGGVRWLNERQVLYTGIDARMNTFFVVDVAGGDAQRLIRNMPAWNPAVSPDGRKIAFVSDKSGRNQIWVADADGQNPRQLTTGHRSAMPSFSADGKYVVYVSYGESQYAFRIRADGTGEPEQLTFAPTSRALMSPDGRWLLCRLRSKGEGDGPLWRTAVVPIDRKGEIRYFGVPRYGAGPHFQWHPSGDGFLFVDSKEGVNNLWHQPLDGREPRQLTFFTSGAIFNYHVASDGKSLLLARGQPTSDAVLIRDWR